MTLNLRSTNLDSLNSLTKYPSIPTYHLLDPNNGGLVEESVALQGAAVLTEKVDGTNARIVCTGGGEYIIGSRGEFLFARGDLIGNPALGIVDTLRQLAERIVSTRKPLGVTVYYGEVYGGTVTQASKQYTGRGQMGFRLFDVITVEDHTARLSRSREEISRWRESGGQSFLDESRLQEEATALGVEVTPRLGEVESLPQTLEATHAFLKERLAKTLSALDEGAGGIPEGIVVRKKDRSQIAKMRFADYKRTLKRRR